MLYIQLRKKSLWQKNIVDTSSTYIFIYILTIWMHLIGGVSRATITKILKFIKIIINISFCTNKEHKSQSTIPIPYNVCTVISSLLIEPQIIWNICCPKCFHHYLLDSLSETCSWRESPWSKRCGEKLWTRCLTRNSPKVVPYQLYTTVK